MNTIELKFFDNISRFKNDRNFAKYFNPNYKVINRNTISINYNQKFNKGYIHIANFFEFYIDGIPLYKDLDKFIIMMKLC